MPSVRAFMKRSDLEHLIRAAGKIGEDSAIVVIGSQAILGQFPDAPQSLLVSAEADVFPLNRPEQSTLIDGAIGEGSRFHQEYGYYAQGVEDGTATLPERWAGRLFAVKNAATPYSSITRQKAPASGVPIGLPS